MIRQAYTSRVRFFHDSNVEREIEWYFVPDNTPVLGLNSSFGSRIDDRLNDEVEADIGERYTPVTWRGGQAPIPAASGGRCGSPEQWLNGASVTDSLPLVWPDTNIPTCCNKPLPVFVGGFAEGGQSKEPSPLCCSDSELPAEVIAQFTILFLYCTPIEAPILLHRSDEQPPQYTQTTKYVSESFTFADAPARLWIACEESTGTMGFWLLADDGIGLYGAGPFFEKSCDPFRLFTSGDFFPGGSWTDCLVFDSSLEVLPA